MRVTLLGTGTSFGVPQIGCACAVCRSDDPRDRRTRTGALLETPQATFLFDTPPELRVQLVAARVDRVDAVLYTHEHADHVMGIDDLRMFSLKARHPLPVYGPAETMAFLRSCFRYIFDEEQPPPGTSKPGLETHTLRAGEPLTIEGVEVLPLAFQHGRIEVFGYRIGRFAYITDAGSIPRKAVGALLGLDLLVMNALWWRPHPTHQSLPEAVLAAQAIGARRTLLTHLTHETGHQELLDKLPEGIEPGYDGQVIEL